VGLSSTGPYYDPEPDCYPGPGCGDPDVFACVDSTPPLRPGIAGYYWGYAYSGASHMQGWIYADPTSIAYAGDDPTHPCALGPAGADYEVAEACGTPTSCSGGTPSCRDTNSCTEGSDDCGATSCGAESGGALTPSAHQGTLALPAAHACTTKTPPDPSVLCPAGPTGRIGRTHRAFLHLHTSYRPIAFGIRDSHVWERVKPHGFRESHA
jgi:hypothetical protein